MEQFSPTVDRVTIEITPLDTTDGQACEVTLTQEVEAMLAAYKNESEQGWMQGFDLLATIVE